MIDKKLEKDIDISIEHPKHYQLSINLEVLDIIKIIMTDGHLNAYQGFVIGNVIKYLFRADKKNGLEAVSYTHLDVYKRQGVCSRNILQVANKEEYKNGKIRKQAGGYIWKVKND